MTISLPTMIESAYVLDTHPLIWHLTNDGRLSRRVEDIFEAAERGETMLIISALVFAEMYYADKKWNLFADFNAVYQLVQNKPYTRLVRFSHTHVLDFPRLEQIPEMHDRILAGIAYRLNIPIITRDPTITASGIVRVEW